MMELPLNQIHQQVYAMSRPLSCKDVFEKHFEWLKLPMKEAFSNYYKEHRELYIVSKLCRVLGLKKCFVAVGLEPADVILEHNGSSYDIQVTECRNEGPRDMPTDITCRRLENGWISYEVLGNMDLTKPIEKEIQKKVDKKYINAESLLLLVYVNIQFSSLTSEGEVDIELLKEKAIDTPFREILLLDNHQNVVFLKKTNLCFF